MTPRSHRALRGSVGLAAAAMACVGLYIAAQAVVAEIETIEFRILLGLAIASFVTVGVILMGRVPGNIVGPFLLASGALMSVGTAAGAYATAAARSEPGSLPGAIVAALLNQVLFFYPIVLVLIAIPLVFPTGRLLSKRWRWLAWLVVVAMLALTAVNLFEPGPISIAGLDNPLGAEELVPLLEVLTTFANLTSVVGFGGAAFSVILRFRRGTPVERQQVKWLAVVAAVAAIAFPGSFLIPDVALADTLFLLGFVTLLCLPLAIGVAILRYRLYEIDRIISRTVGWALVTGAVVAAFAAGVLVLQTALAGLTQGQTLAVAASTLLAFALFQPLRRRIQRAVDRRFDRARYDAERTIDAFAERVRNEVHLPRISASLLTAAGAAVRPVGAGVWLRQPGP